MSYTPDAGDAVTLNLEATYTPEAGNSLVLNLGGGVTGDTCVIGGTFEALTGYVNAAAIVADAEIAATFRDMYAEVLLPIDWTDVSGEFGVMRASITVDQPFTASIAGALGEITGAVDATTTAFTATIAGEFGQYSGTIFHGESILGTFQPMTASVETSTAYSASIAGTFEEMVGTSTVAYTTTAQIAGVLESLFGMIAAEKAITVSIPGIMAFARDSRPTFQPTSPPVLSGINEFERDAVVAPTDTSGEITDDILAFTR